jgi:nitroreductase
VNFSELVRRRRMVRSFTDEPVAPEVVDRILDVARRGPSAGYTQGVDFIVITNKETRHAIAASSDEVLAKINLANFVAQAPVQVVICVSPERYRARYREPDKQRVISDWDDERLWQVPYWHTDGGAAMMLLLLAAVDEGIGAAFVSGDFDLMRELLAIPEDYLPIGMALLGHEAPDARDIGDVSAKTRPRRPFTEVVHRERWTPPERGDP